MTDQEHLHSREFEAQRQESSDLRQCVNSLVGIFAMRALWAVSEPDEVARALADIVITVVDCDFVLVHLCHQLSGSENYLFRRGKTCPDEITKPTAVEAFIAWMSSETRLGPFNDVRCIQGHSLSCLAHHLGSIGEFGSVFIGSSRAAFPRDTEKLLVNVAVSQAVIALQEKFRLSEQIAAASNFERLVVERTQELARANTELRRKEFLLSEAQRLSQTGSFRWNPENGNIELSEQAQLLFGGELDSSTQLGEISKKLAPTHTALFSACMSDLRLGRAVGEEFRFVLSAGDIRILKFVADPSVIAQDPSECEIVGAIQDVTEFHRAQDKARQQSEKMRELQQEVAHANRLAIVGQLTTALSHEVGQPLQIISTSIATAARWLKRGTPNVGAAMTSLSLAASGATRAIEIFQRTKSFAGRARQNFELCSVNEILIDTLSLLRQDAQLRGIELRYSMEDQLPDVEMDRMQIQQVVLNLIVNAMEALTEDTHGKKIIDVRSSQPGNKLVEISVADTGPGMSDDVRSRLFEAFFTTKRNGTGLGLAISREIVAGHSGTLCAETLLPHGSVFKLSLPTRQEFRQS